MALLNHFRPEERMFALRVMEWAELVASRHRPRLTSFLDPREQLIVQAIVGREAGIQVSFNGGYEQAERKRAYLYPDYLEESDLDYELALLSVRTGQKEIPFSHRDLLGSILGLGLKREKVGDIILTEETAQVIVTEDIADYIHIHLEQIGRYRVSTTRLEWSQLVLPEEKWLYQQASVSSMRLDAILAELTRLSRSKVIPLIKSGKVKVNWKIVDQPSFQLEEGDQLSVQGYGRFLFAKVEGKTKKDRFRVTLGRKE